MRWTVLGVGALVGLVAACGPGVPRDGVRVQTTLRATEQTPHLADYLSGKALFVHGRLDGDGDRRVSAGEFARAYPKGYTGHSRMFGFEELDGDRDGALTSNELVAGLASSREQDGLHELLHYHFSVFDEDRTESIHPGEVLHRFRDLPSRTVERLFYESADPMHPKWLDMRDYEVFSLAYWRELYRSGSQKHEWELIGR